MRCKEISLNKLSVWSLYRDGKSCFYESTLYFWVPNGIKYIKINLIFWIIILSYYLDKNSTAKVLNPQISTFRKKISPKILYALMKTIN